MEHRTTLTLDFPFKISLHHLSSYYRPTQRFDVILDHSWSFTWYLPYFTIHSWDFPPRFLGSWVPRTTLAPCWPSHLRSCRSYLSRSPPKKPTDGFDGIRDPILGYHRATVSQVCQEKYGTYGKYVCNDCVMLCTRTPQKVHQVWPCRWEIDPPERSQPLRLHPSAIAMVDVLPNPRFDGTGQQVSVQGSQFHPNELKRKKTFWSWNSRNR